MFLRVDQLLIDLPMPKKQDPNAGAALQELLGGKYGEMSTLNNYMYQSFNFRSKARLRAIYDIVASITAEEVGHVELVANGVAMLNNGPDSDETGGADISDAPYWRHGGHPPCRLLPVQWRRGHAGRQQRPALERQRHEHAEPDRRGEPDAERNRNDDVEFGHAARLCRDPATITMRAIRPHQARTGDRAQPAFRGAGGDLGHASDKGRRAGRTVKAGARTVAG